LRAPRDDEIGKAENIEWRPFMSEQPCHALVVCRFTHMRAIMMTAGFDTPFIFALPSPVMQLMFTDLASYMLSIEECMMTFLG